MWQKPGGDDLLPAARRPGYSLYVGGRRVATVDDLAHVTWDSKTGDGRRARRQRRRTSITARRAASRRRPRSASPTTPRRRRLPEGGLDLKPQSSGLVNLALGKPATASFTTTTPGARRRPRRPTRSTASRSAASRSRPAPTWARNPIWGDNGSPNAQDWLQIDLGAPKRFDHVKLYFFSNKASGRERQHLQGAERVLDPVLRRRQLGRRPRPGQVAGRARAQLQPRRLPGGDRAARAGAGDEVDDAGARGRHQGGPGVRHDRADADAGARGARRHGPGDAGTAARAIGAPATVGDGAVPARPGIRVRDRRRRVAGVHAPRSTVAGRVHTVDYRSPTPRPRRDGEAVIVRIAASRTFRAP